MLVQNSGGQDRRFLAECRCGDQSHERNKTERLCRYISRPAVSEKRLSLSPNEKVRYQLKTPYRDGATQVIFEPLDFIVRLATPAPKPRVTTGLTADTSLSSGTLLLGNRSAAGECGRISVVTGGLGAKDSLGATLIKPSLGKPSLRRSQM